MTDPSPASRPAVQALEAVRPAVERLSPSRSSQDNAADVAAICSGVELALGALLARSDLAGQPLVREARQRELISLEQAHAALEVFAVRERVRAGSEIAPGDLEVARQAYDSLARGFAAAPETTAATSGPPAAEPLASPPSPPSPAAAPPPPDVTPTAADSLGAVPGAPPHDSPPSRAPAIALFIVVLALAGAAFYWFGARGRSSALDAGVAAYAAGQRDSARALFARAAAADPRAALPHLYLGRLAREDGDFTTAGKELRAAIQLDPTSAAGERELGAFFLARGGSFAAQSRPDLATQDYDAARRAYVRAIQADPADSASEGYLACALARLGRGAEAASWLGRAGQGPWSSCAAAPAASPPPRAAP